MSRAISVFDQHTPRVSGARQRAMAAVPDAAPAPKRYRVTQKVSPFYVALLASLGPETDLNQRVYLVTVSRVFRGTAAGHGYRDLAEVTREDVGRMVRDAFEHPLNTQAGGRPRADGAERLVFLVAVAKEYHADGSPHFHIVVKFAHRMRFKAAKYTVQHREGLPTIVAFPALDRHPLHPCADDE